MTEYYFNGRHEYLEEENNDQEEVEDDDAYKLGWSYHKLGFDHTMWKHLSNQSYYYQVEYGFDYHQDEDTDDGTEGDAVAEGNEEYINYQIRRLWNDGNYYIGTVVTSIAPRFTDDNVLVRTVAYADGDKDIADEKQLREWKYTTVNDDDDDDDDDADSSHDDDDTVAEGNPKKAGAASIIDSIQDKSHSIRIDNRKKEAKQTRRRFGTRRWIARGLYKSTVDGFTRIGGCHWWRSFPQLYRIDHGDDPERIFQFWDG